jgi:hypothetical protein
MARARLFCALGKVSYLHTTPTPTTTPKNKNKNKNKNKQTNKKFQISIFINKFVEKKINSKQLEIANMRFRISYLSF